jgi:hypothetical protein
VSKKRRFRKIKTRTRLSSRAPVLSVRRPPVRPYIVTQNYGNNFHKLDVRRSVHHRKIHKEKHNKMQQYIKILLFHIIWNSTCFGRHTAHYQELKTALTASGFSYVEGCWMCSWWTCQAQYTVRDMSTNYTSNNLPRMKKPEAASAVLGSW